MFASAISYIFQQHAEVSYGRCRQARYPTQHYFYTLTIAYGRSMRASPGGVFTTLVTYLVYTSGMHGSALLALPKLYFLEC